jgi:glucokinase
MPAREDPFVVGVDVGGTNMQFGVVAAGGRVVGRAAAKTGAADGLDAVLDRIAAGVDAACRAAGLTRAETAAVGVACAGAVDLPRGVVITAPNLGWSNVPLADLLARRLDRPVVVENDVNGAAWGEYSCGAGPGTGDALGVWVGTGVGGAVIIGGRLHYGTFHTAGEIGQTVCVPPGDVHGDVRPRTVEDFCSRSGMSAIVEAALRRGASSAIARAGRPAPSITTEVLRDAWEAGDALVAPIVNRGADLLGVAIANCVTLLAVDVVLLGGGMVESLGAPYVDRVRASFAANVFPSPLRACRILTTKLAADAGLVGAALLASARIPRGAGRTPPRAPARGTGGAAPGESGPATPPR